MRQSVSILVMTATAALAIALLVGCSDGSAIAPKAASHQSFTYSPAGRTSSILGPIGVLDMNRRVAHQFKSFYSCPATGRLEYVADFGHTVIFVYSGDFASQAPCGQLTSGLVQPDGMYVKTGTHDLYVANNTPNILVFHRGQTTPFNTYTDPGAPIPIDVAVAKDGTVLASNLNCSISTWIGGPNGGTFVGNFPMTNCQSGYETWITVKKNGTVYFDDHDVNSTLGAVWSLSCPAGACGIQTRVAGVSLRSACGLGFNATDDLLASDTNPGAADTFELPNPNPKTFPVRGLPFSLAFDELHHRWFTGDPEANAAYEYMYPGGKFVGMVHGTLSGQIVGVAVDP